jgi:hypothetical protein
MSLTETYDPTGFTCAVCGSEVILWTQTMFTSAAPGGTARARKYQCRLDASHDLGQLEVQIRR